MSHELCLHLWPGAAPPASGFTLVDCLRAAPLALSARQKSDVFSAVQATLALSFAWFEGFKADSMILGSPEGHPVESFMDTVHPAALRIAEGLLPAP